MAKYGFIYETMGGLTVGVFDAYFSAPHSVADINPAAAIVNPVPDAYHLLSVNMRYDLSRYLDRPCHSCEVQFLVQNALDEEIWHPEFSRRRINSVPAQAGRTFYGGFTWAY
jgi:outer membrane receptor for ferrienterochelin and colicins